MRQGRVVTTRQDGAQLDEANRCAGCMRLVCDRHPWQGEGQVTDRHIMDDHGDAPNVTVTPV